MPFAEIFRNLTLNFSNLIQNIGLVFVIIAAISLLLAIRSLRKNKNKKVNYEIKDGVCLSIEVPKFNEKDAVASEQMFSSLHGLLKYSVAQEAQHFSFEIVSDENGIKFYAYVPKYFQNFIESQIYAQYPSAEIKTVEDYTLAHNPPSLPHVGCDMGFVKENYFPIKTFRDFAVDPLAAITAAMEKVESNGKLWMQLLISPLPDGWQKEGYAYIDRIRAGKEEAKPFGIWLLEFLTAELGNLFMQFLASLFDSKASVTSPSSTAAAAKPLPAKVSSGVDLALKSIEEKLAGMGFAVGIRIVALSETEEGAQKELSSAVAALKQFSTSNLNSIERSPVVIPSDELFENYVERRFPEDQASFFIFNISELASIFHLPSVSVETPAIAWVSSKKGEPPLDLPTDKAVTFARTVFRDKDTKFGIRREDRRQHMYIIGKTGTGKSTLMKNMFIRDVIDGEGCAYVDPHGDAIEELLEYIPEERLKDVVLFDPGDSQHPVALNMLEMFDLSQKNLYGSGLLDVFKKFWADVSWGPRLEYILRNCILTLLEVPNTTLLAIPRLLIDYDYQNYIVSLVTDPVLKKFWEGEMASIRQNNPKLYTDSIAPIQNKVGQFLAASTIRNIVGQAKSSIRIDEVIDNGKIFLCNLSKGKIGTDNSAILGALVISRLQFAAMARVKIPEKDRRDFYVYVDEFQNFATTSFSEILSEARKYHLNLILGHQYIAQLPEEVRDAIFGNVGSLIAFGVGPDDANFLAREFAPVFEETDLINQKKYHIYLKLLINGMTSLPFSAMTLPPEGQRCDLKQQAIDMSRSQYSKDVVVIEERMRRWSETKFKKGMGLGLPVKKENDIPQDTEVQDELPEAKEIEVVPEPRNQQPNAMVTQTITTVTAGEEKKTIFTQENSLQPKGEIYDGSDINEIQDSKNHEEADPRQKDNHPHDSRIRGEIYQRKV